MPCICVFVKLRENLSDGMIEYAKYTRSATERSRNPPWCHVNVTYIYGDITQVSYKYTTGLFRGENLWWSAQIGDSRAECGLDPIPVGNELLRRYMKRNLSELPRGQFSRRVHARAINHRGMSGLRAKLAASLHWEHDRALAGPVNNEPPQSFIKLAARRRTNVSEYRRRSKWQSSTQGTG